MDGKYALLFSFHTLQVIFTHLITLITFRIVAVSQLLAFYGIFLVILVKSKVIFAVPGKNIIL